MKINSTKLRDGKALLAQVKKNIRRGYATWRKTFDDLEEPDKTAFATHTFLDLVRNKDSKEKSYKEHRYDSSWEAAVYAIIRHVGMKKLIAMEWPNGRNFVQVLVDTGLEVLVGKALKFPAAVYSLLSVDKDGCTPLHVAVRRGLMQAVTSILAHDDASGSLRTRRDNQKQIPLHMTGKQTPPALVRALLDRNGMAQRMAVSNGGSLPIHQAVESGAGKRTIDLLLEECAAEQCLAQRAEDKCTALMLAIRCSSAYTVTALLAVEDTVAEQLVARDANGHTPIVYAQVSRNKKVSSLIDSATHFLHPSTSSTAFTASTAPTQAPPQDRHDSTAQFTPYRFVAVKEEGVLDTIIEEELEADHV